MQNVIKREVVIAAPREKIYQAIADPELVTAWFPEAVEGSFAPGERPILDFGDGKKNQVYIVDAKPHEYFAYRWIPGSDHFMGDVLGEQNTLVEFRIQEAEDQTCTVTLTEAGFADLPDEIAEDAREQNAGGWEYMLDRLEKHFATA